MGARFPQCCPFSGWDLSRSQNHPCGGAEVLLGGPCANVILISCREVLSQGGKEKGTQEEGEVAGLVDGPLELQ